MSSLDPGRCRRGGHPEPLKGRDFTRVGDWSTEELATALDLADELKIERARRKELRILPGRTVGLIFRKPSTRTRISFEVGIAELGGTALYVPAADLQLSRGETLRATRRSCSRASSARSSSAPSRSGGRRARGARRRSPSSTGSRTGRIRCRCSPTR